MEPSQIASLSGIVAAVAAAIFIVVIVVLRGRPTRKK
jgi:hypothetical protein